MALTGADIRAALAAVGAVGGQMTSLDNLAAGANDALSRAPAGLTPAGAAAFLATMAQESAYFRTTIEYSAGRNRYSPYDGRTFEMLTWEANYRGFGQWCKAKGRVTDSECFVKNPRSLADYRWAWDGGVWFFDHNNLWKYANAGNFLAVSQGVNGGNGTIGSSWKPTGWNARNAMYQALLHLGNALLPSGSSTETSSTTHADTGQDLNKWMSKLRVTQLQQELGVDQDGIAGPDTVRALETRAGYKSVADGVLPVNGSATVRKMQVTLNVSEITKANLAVDGVLGPDTGAQIEKYMHGGGRFVNLAKMATTWPPKKPKPKPKTPTTPKGTAFPLGKDNYFGVDDKTAWSHSGVRGGPDEANVTKIQRKVGTTADGIFGTNTKAAVAKFQKAHKLTGDGKVGAKTWAELGL